MDSNTKKLQHILIINSFSIEVDGKAEAEAEAEAPMADIKLQFFEITFL